MLVVGDPGMGKSQMLTATAALAPRGVYVCGNTTSSSGLTVTVVKDAVSGDFALEAGGARGVFERFHLEAGRSGSGRLHSSAEVVAPVPGQP